MKIRIVSNSPPPRHIAHHSIFFAPRKEVSAHTHKNKNMKNKKKHEKQTKNNKKKT